MGWVEDVLKALEGRGWRVSLAPGGLREATGIVALGVRDGWPRPVWACPECGHEPEVAFYTVGEGQAMGFACPACGRLGLEGDLPKASRPVARTWGKGELLEELRRLARARVPRSLGEEEARLKGWAERKIEEALQEVRSAPPSARNVTLARMAARVGVVLARVEIVDPEEAVERLVEAAMVAGLPRHEAMDTARRQVRWGLERGRA